ncbi:MAG: amidase family protein, partial [Anaerolineae bacterium]|nr:amidase family protein [Anaerolineae bacterium]
HADMDPGLLDAAEKGRAYTAVERMSAETSRATYGARMDRLLNEFDLLMSPTVPIPAFEAGRDTPGGSAFRSWVEWSSFSFPVNLSQQPACSVPCGLTGAGLPVGLQIIGPRGGDAAVLSAALTIEQMHPGNFLSTRPVWPPVAREAA